MPRNLGDRSETGSAATMKWNNLPSSDFPLRARFDAGDFVFHVEHDHAFH
jgi:hypothetical protein